ncbi:hypothetical protein B0H10DRAFT_1938440 [Mycena sp. CBHHK59/15]|nr:hypothetical protein B0H10DRAFT_1938440 [Mycena sp. CBHHK59/15]
MAAEKLPLHEEGRISERVVIAAIGGWRFWAPVGDASILVRRLTRKVDSERVFGVGLAALVFLLDGLTHSVSTKKVHEEDIDRYFIALTMVKYEQKMSSWVFDGVPVFALRDKAYVHISLIKALKLRLNLGRG